VAPSVGATGDANEASGWAAISAALSLAMLAGTTAWAGTSGSGTQRWAASYRYGAPAFSTATAVSPDGSTVFVTGTTALGPTGRFATLAYDAVTGAEKWIARYPSSSSEDWGRGNGLTVSADSSTLFVTGATKCHECVDPSAELFTTIAYDTSSGTRLWVKRFASSGGPYSIALSPDGSKLFVNGQVLGGESTETIAYSPTTGEQLWAVEGDFNPVYWGGALSVSPDSSTVFVSGSARPTEANGCVDYSGGYRTTAYDASDGSVRWATTHQLGSGYCGTATSLGMTPDGSTVFVTGYGRSRAGGSGPFVSATVAYDAVTGTQVWSREDNTMRVLSGDTVLPLGVSNDGSKVFVLGYDCTDSCSHQTFVTTAYDASTGGRHWLSRYDGGGRGYPQDLAVSPDGSAVFVTGQEHLPCFAPCTTSEVDAPLVAYDSETGAEQWASTYRNNTGWAIAVSTSGSSVFLAGTFTASTSTSCSDVCGYSAARYNARPGPGTFQESSPGPSYNSWRSIFNKTAVGGAYRASNIRGSTATFKTPKVASIVWLTHQGPNQGKARVTIDGHTKGTFNLYSAVPSARSVTFQGLPRTAHTVRVQVLGTKDSFSNGTWVAVDGFELKVGSGTVQESSRKVRYNSWSGVSHAAASGGSYRRSGSPVARASLSFTGRTVTWVTATGPAFGRAKVVIDGHAQFVDLYRRTRSWKVAIPFTGLSNGTHHISVRPLGRKNASSTSTNVVIDAFVVRS
jgi:hypothetical protein